MSVFSLKLEEENEELEFLCPSDIVIFPVNGNDNYWIRARLVSGDYGKGRLVQTTVSTLTTRETRKIRNAEDGTTEDTTEKTTEWNAGTFEWDYSEIKAPKFKQVKVKSTDPKTYKIKKNNQDRRPYSINRCSNHRNSRKGLSTYVHDLQQFRVQGNYQIPI